jgi:hypothetical protein
VSHFVVIVIGDDFEKQLAPYQENNMCDCPQQYLKFFDVEPECQDTYTQDTLPRWKDPDGELHAPYAERFTNEHHNPFGWVQKDAVPPPEVQEYITGIVGEPPPFDSMEKQQAWWAQHISSRTLKPKDYEEVQIPIKDTMSFTSYIEDYHGYSKDEKIGKYGYWENPNAKWDWYQVGGRYRGYFPVKLEVPVAKSRKPEITGDMEQDIQNLVNFATGAKPDREDSDDATTPRVGEAGAFGNAPEPGTADRLRAKHIDWERAHKEVRAEAELRWEAWEELYTKYGKARAFSEMRDEHEAPDKETMVHQATARSNHGALCCGEGR